MARYGFNIGLDGHRIQPMTEKEAQEIADGLVEVYAQARERMLEAVSKRLARGVGKFGWAERKTGEVLEAHHQLESNLQRVQRERENLISNSIDRAYMTGSQQFHADMVHALGTLGVEHVSPNAAKAAYILADLNNSLNAAERRILRQFDDKYADVIGAVSSKMATGIYNTRQALGEALTAFADQGITGFTDRSGRHWTLENYAEMALLTAIERSTISGYVDTMESYGYDLAVIDGHAGSCPICEAWEGVIISISGDNGDYPSLDEAEGAGCFHPRCLHGIHTYYPGITHEPKGGFRNEPREIESQSPQYTARSKQRYCERMIRKYKDRAIVAQTPLQKKQALNKVHEWEDALDELIGKQPSDDYLYRHKERERTNTSLNAVKASVDMFNHLDPLHEYIKKVEPLPGFEDIGIHGDRLGFAYKDADGNESHLSVKEFAEIIRKSGSYHGGNIRLLSCETGADGAIAAQGLADELGVNVMAPSDVLYIHFDGSMTIGDILTSTGKWVIFEPRQK